VLHGIPFFRVLCLDVQQYGRIPTVHHAQAELKAADDCITAARDTIPAIKPLE
jgi:hypothetical protein